MKRSYNEALASSDDTPATATPTATTTTTTTASNNGGVVYSVSANPVHIPHAFQEINGRQITVVWIEDKRWMIGVQVAALLERETYNLYRSMKVKNIEVRRATVEQIDFLLKHDIVRSGTRSITFVSLDQSISFLADELKKLEKKKQKAALASASVPDSSFGGVKIENNFTYNVGGNNANGYNNNNKPGGVIPVSSLASGSLSPSPEHQSAHYISPSALYSHSLPTMLPSQHELQQQQLDFSASSAEAAFAAVEAAASSMSAGPSSIFKFEGINSNNTSNSSNANTGSSSTPSSPPAFSPFCQLGSTGLFQSSGSFSEFPYSTFSPFTASYDRSTSTCSPQPIHSAPQDQWLYHLYHSSLQ